MVLGTAAATVAANPAVAASPTCGNVYVWPSAPSASQVVARICIHWSGAPAGNAYTVQGLSIWNPPCCDAGTVYSTIRYNDGATDYTAGGVADGHTFTRGADHVGALTTRFQVDNNYHWGPYCLYLAPDSPPALFDRAC